MQVLIVSCNSNGTMLGPPLYCWARSDSWECTHKDEALRREKPKAELLRSHLAKMPD